jgi:hypothetical protein
MSQAGIAVDHFVRVQTPPGRGGYLWLVPRAQKDVAEQLSIPPVLVPCLEWLARSAVCTLTLSGTNVLPQAKSSLRYNAG